MKLFEALFDIITLPLEVGKDIVTLGGELGAGGETYTRKRMKKIDKDLDD